MVGRVPPNLPCKTLLSIELKFIEYAMALVVARSECGCLRTLLDNHVVLVGSQSASSERLLRPHKNSS